MTAIAIETSSYLPLIWNTPYTASIRKILNEHSTERDNSLIIHRDSIREARGYVSAVEGKVSDSDRWRYDAAFRAEFLAHTMSDSTLSQADFPSMGVQVIAGGSMWPAAKYLNYSRHCVFLFSDLLDNLAPESSIREKLELLAVRIRERTATVTRLFDQHLASTQFTLPLTHPFAYWGHHFVGEHVDPIRVAVLDDNHQNENYETRDAYHYALALREEPRPSYFVVGDQGFAKNVKVAKLKAAIPILTAVSWKL